MRWPWVPRRRLLEEQIAGSLLRHHIRLLQDELADLRDELGRTRMQAAEAMDHGFRMGTGQGYQAEHGEPLGGG